MSINIGGHYYAFDLSIAQTGVAIFNENDLENPIYYGVIKTKQKDNHQNRLRFIYEEARNLRNQYPPISIASERPFIQMRTAVEAIYKVHGVISLLFSDIDQTYYAPATIKKEFAGHGRASKEKMIEKVGEVYGIKAANDDEADALAIAWVHFRNIGVA